MLRLVFGKYLRESIPVNTVRTSRHNGNNWRSRSDIWCLLIRETSQTVQNITEHSFSELPRWMIFDWSQWQHSTQSSQHFSLSHTRLPFFFILPLRSISFQNKDRGHLVLFIRTGPNIVAAFATLRAEVCPFVPVFSFATDALRLWSSGESVDERWE